MGTALLSLEVSESDIGDGACMPVLKPALPRRHDRLLVEEMDRSVEQLAPERFKQCLTPYAAQVAEE